MKIFGIGLPRTGTTSLAVAFLEIGLKTAHCAYIPQVYDAADAILDFPVYTDYKVLDYKYPGSKFVLTWRDPDKWYHSYKATVYEHWKRMKDSNKPEDAVPRRALLTIFGKKELTKLQLIQRYKAHRQEVQNYFKDRPGDLLILEMDDTKYAWKKIEQFFGYRTPKKPFPHANPGDSWTDWEDIQNRNKVDENTVQANFGKPEFTIAIPTKNSCRTISMVLEYLKFQQLELDILIADNNSWDGTFELIQAQIASNYYNNRPNLPYLNIKIHQAGQVGDGNQKENIPYIRRYLANNVQTPYIFWLDSDVKLTSDSLRDTFKEFIARKHLVGIYGIRYEPRTDHVQIGCSFMETAIARRINWKMDEFCECREAHIQIGDELKLGSDIHPVFQAQHLKIL